MTILACIIAAVVGFPIGYLLGAAWAFVNEVAAMLTAPLIVLNLSPLDEKANP